MSVGEARAPLKHFGSFEILERLGVGGAGNVYKARHPDFAAPIALKVAHPAVAEDLTLSQRFQNEYSLGKNLLHPNLVQVLAYGIEEGLPYLVTEFVPGCNLHERIERDGEMNVDEAIALFRQITDVVGFIHQRNLVHRDIKPANLLIDPSGTVKLTDLNLIKDMSSTIGLTRSRVALGTPDYGAPEQFEDAARVDHRCDIYALGVSLYFALTGVFPFGRASPAAIMRRKASFEFAPLSQVLNQVSHGIDQTVIRSLHPDPQMRPSSVADFMVGILEPSPSNASDLSPAFPPSYEFGAKERRTLKRYELKIENVKVSPSTDAPSIDAELVNVSAAGICLRMPRAFSIGTSLSVAFPTDQPPVRTRVQVCWIRQTSDNCWLLGFLLAPAMNDSQLQVFLNSYLPKTEISRERATA